MIQEPNWTTEQRNPASMQLDQLSVRQALHLFNQEDHKVAEAIQTALPQIEEAVDLIVDSFEKGGRLIYMGAGTSGRLGILDASECPPTFGVDPGMVVGLIAGGLSAITQALEGAEDDFTQGKEDLSTIDLSQKDTVVGLAASGRTPYVLGGLEYARRVGAHTVAIACNQDSKIGAAADIAIEAVVGPEVLTGSTRLKAGTAQKLILNMLSTVSMVQIGKVYQNLMVDVQATNEKLRQRAVKIVMAAAEVDETLAKAKLAESEGDVKTAIVMLLLDLDQTKAQQALESAGGKINRLT